MSAGTGLRHEEYNVGEGVVNFLQIWIEPKLQNITPRYQRKYFPEEQRLNQLQTVVSYEEGQAHCWINQNAKISLGAFDTHQKIEYKLNPLNKAVFAFCIEGQFIINGQATIKRDAIGVWDTNSISIGVESGTRLLLLDSPINH